jgi:hypothetical protein
VDGFNDRRVFLKTVMGSVAVLTSAAIVKAKVINTGKRMYTKEEDEMFDRIWEATKHWDLDNDGKGYHAMNGDQVRTIIRAIRRPNGHGR